MEITYTDKNGILQSLTITKSDHLIGLVYAIYRNGIFVCEILQNTDGSWRDLYAGSTEFADGYGQLIDKHRL